MEGIMYNYLKNIVIKLTINIIILLNEVLKEGEGRGGR